MSARSAFPAVSELQDKQLQNVLQWQLRLYTTGACSGHPQGLCLKPMIHVAEKASQLAADI